MTSVNICVLLMTCCFTLGNSSKTSEGRNDDRFFTNQSRTDVITPHHRNKTKPPMAPLITRPSTPLQEEESHLQVNDILSEEFITKRPQDKERKPSSQSELSTTLKPSHRTSAAWDDDDEQEEKGPLSETEITSESPLKILTTSSSDMMMGHFTSRATQQPISSTVESGKQRPSSRIHAFKDYASHSTESFIDKIKTIFGGKKKRPKKKTERIDLPKDSPQDRVMRDTGDTNANADEELGKLLGLSENLNGKHGASKRGVHKKKLGHHRKHRERTNHAKIMKKSVPHREKNIVSKNQKKISHGKRKSFPHGHRREDNKKTASGSAGTRKSGEGKDQIDKKSKVLRHRKPTSATFELENQKKRKPENLKEKSRRKGKTKGYQYKKSKIISEPSPNKGARRNKAGSNLGKSATRGMLHRKKSKPKVADKIKEVDSQNPSEHDEEASSKGEGKSSSHVFRKNEKETISKLENVIEEMNGLQRKAPEISILNTPKSTKGESEDKSTKNKAQKKHSTSEKHNQNYNQAKKRNRAESMSDETKIGAVDKSNVVEKTEGIEPDDVGIGSWMPKGLNDEPANVGEDETIQELETEVIELDKNGAVKAKLKSPKNAEERHAVVETATDAKIKAMIAKKTKIDDQLHKLVKKEKAKKEALASKRKRVKSRRRHKGKKKNKKGRNKGLRMGKEKKEESINVDDSKSIKRAEKAVEKLDLSTER